MNEKPVLSIITICSNDSYRLNETLESMKNLPNTVEHITVVPHADVDSNQIWAEFTLKSPGNFRLVRDSGSGVYEAMNQGGNCAKGDYLVFWNTGEKLLSSSALSNFINQLKIQSPSWAIFQIERETSKSEFNFKTVESFLLHKPNGFISHQAVAVRRDLFVWLNGFNLRYRIASDTHMILKLCIFDTPLISRERLAYVEAANLSAKYHRRSRVEVLVIYLSLAGVKRLIPFFYYFLKRESLFFLNKVKKL
jgi:hypothetical protein